MTTTARLLPEGFTLAHGSHPAPNGEVEACLLEATARVAGEGGSDEPEGGRPGRAAPRILGGVRPRGGRGP